MGDNYLLSKLDRRLANRQAKKDDQFAPPVSFQVKEKTAEDLRRDRDRAYMEATFPDEESAYEKNVRSPSEKKVVVSDRVVVVLDDADKIERAWNGEFIIGVDDL